MKMQSKRRAIDKIYKRRDRYDIPEWQRQEVWSQKKKQSFLDSILQQWKVPKFYFLKLSGSPERYEVVDGQQRLAAILQFFENKLPLTDASVKEFGGPFYRDLRDEISDAFDDYEIEFDEIEDATDEEVRDFFQRLQEGLRLTSSERLNSIPSNLRDFVVGLTGHPLFSRIAASNRRYGHFDIVAKVVAIEIDEIEVGLRYDDLKAVFESQRAFSDQSNVGKRLGLALDFVDKGFGDNVSLLRNRTVVQSLLTLVCRLVKSTKAQDQEKRVADFFVQFLKELNKQVEMGQRATDTDYLEFQRTVNANIKEGAHVRHGILLRKLLAFEPTFVVILDPATIAESGMQTAVKRDVAEIVRLIGELNEQYAAKHGENLFKPTNRTTQAQARIAVPLRDFGEYKTFIDDLYFLTHEGVGSRLQDQIPQSFSDINTLRTDLQHDVEHGDKRKIRANKLKAGRVFRKYASTSSPVGLAPDQFIIVQANLLASVRRNMNTIKT